MIAAEPDADVAAQLAATTSLYEDGILSRREYETKYAEISGGPPPTPREWSAPRAPRPDRFPRSLPSRPPFFFFLALPWGGMAAAARVPNARCRERGRRRCSPDFLPQRKIHR